MHQSNGLEANAMHSIKYAYKDPVYSRHGGGFLGFTSVIATDATTHYEIVTKNAFLKTGKRVIPYTYSSQTNYPNTQAYDYNVSPTNIEMNNTNTGTYWLKNYLSVNENTMRQTTSYTYRIFDDYGNVISTNSDLNNNAFSGITSNEYAAVGIAGIPNRLIKTFATTRRGQDALETSAAFTYDPTTAALLTQTNYTNLGVAESLKTTYLYNGFGNMTKATVTALGGGLADRYKAYTYDSKGRMPIASENTLGQTASQTTEADIDWRYGQPSRYEVLGIQGSYKLEYDIWGRNIKTISPIGVEVYNEIGWDIRTGTANSITEADNSVFYTKKTSTSSDNQQMVWYDLLGRPRQAQTLGFDGTKVNSVVNYDDKGNRNQSTMPFFEGTTPTNDQINTFLYDDLNRPVGNTNGRGTTNVAYSFTATHDIVTTTNYSGITKTYKKDKVGSLATVTDQNGTLNYTYAPDGQQTKIDNGTQVLAAMTYDDRRRQTKLIDPNAGTTQYAYDAFNQLLWQQDNEGNKYVMKYDDAGRITYRALADGSEATNFEYVPTGNYGVNQVASVSYHNGYYDQFKYDEYSRMVSQSQYAYFAATTNYTFDANGRASTVEYPSGYVLQYGYNNFGYMQTIGDNTVTHFNAETMDAWGNYTKYTQANNIVAKKTFDDLGFPTGLQTSSGYNQFTQFDWATGNLTQRGEHAYDSFNEKLEGFEYDAQTHEKLLNATVSINGTTQTPQTITYTDNGNIASKSDAGEYEYNHTTKINAVTQILNQQTIGLQNQNVKYNKFKKPEYISEGEYTTTITYGADEERRTMKQERTSTVNGQPQTTLVLMRHYFDNYEITQTTDAQGAAVFFETTYIGGGDGLASVMLRTYDIEAQTLRPTKIYATYTDYLGSILVADDISNNGPQRSNANTDAFRDIDRSFDAWGKIRKAEDWANVTQTDINNALAFAPSPLGEGWGEAWKWLPRGYTGHEHLLEYGIINMNARLYDPALARMLSPDNLVSDPTNTQAYNRYSYVWNNPMKYTDPSGNDLVGAVIGAVGNAVGGMQQVTTTASRFCNGTVVSSSTSAASPAAQGIGGALAFFGGLTSAINAGQAGEQAGRNAAGQAMGGKGRLTVIMLDNPGIAVNNSKVEELINHYLKTLYGGYVSNKPAVSIITQNSVNLSVAKRGYIAVVGKTSAVRKYYKQNLQDYAGDSYINGNLGDLNDESIGDISRINGKGIAISGPGVSKVFADLPKNYDNNVKLALTIMHGLGHNLTPNVSIDPRVGGGDTGGHTPNDSKNFMMDAPDLRTWIWNGARNIHYDFYDGSIKSANDLFKPQNCTELIPYFENIFFSSWLFQ